MSISFVFEKLMIGTALVADQSVMKLSILINFTDREYNYEVCF